MRAGRRPRCRSRPASRPSWSTSSRRRSCSSSSPARSSRACSACAARKPGSDDATTITRHVRRRGDGPLMDGLINGLYGIPIVGLVFQFAGLPRRDVLPIIAPIILAVGDAASRSARCAASCASGPASSTSASRGSMLVAAFVGWVVGVALRAAFSARPDLPVFGITPPLLIAPRRGARWRRCCSRCSTPGCRSASGPTRSSAARSSTSPRSGVTGYLNTLIVGRARRRAPAASPRSRPPHGLTNLPVVGWLFDMFLDQGPIAMSRHRHRDRPPGPAVPVPLGPADAGGRRAPEGRRDGRASTSSGCATGTSSLGGAVRRARRART